MESLVGYAHACGTVQGVSGDRRYRTHALDLRYGLCAGGARCACLRHHACDYFHGDVPCARALTQEEIDTAYEKNTGTVISETLEGKNVLEIPAILVKNHGPFTWGKDADEAVYMPRCWSRSPKPRC